MLANSVEQASGLLRTAVNSFPISYRREIWTWSVRHDSSLMSISPCLCDLVFSTISSPLSAFPSRYIYGRVYLTILNILAGWVRSAKSGSIAIGLITSPY